MITFTCQNIKRQQLRFRSKILKLYITIFTCLSIPVMKVCRYLEYCIPLKHQHAQDIKM